jgi:hypothetical protein
MSKEYIILISTWVISIGLLWVVVPKEKHREAQVSFLFMQSFALLFGAIVVELKLIQYPVRFFDYTFKNSFTFEFLAFPTVSVLFNIFFPKENPFYRKLLYSMSYPTVLIIFEVFLEKYTDNIEYLNWNWFYSWITMWGALLLSYYYYIWFFKYHKNKHVQTNANK